MYICQVQLLIANLFNCTMDIWCVSIKCGWQVVVDRGTHDMTGKVLFSLIEGNTGPYSFLSVDMSKSINYTS